MLTDKPSETGLLKELKNYLSPSLTDEKRRRSERLALGRASFREYCGLISPAFFKPERKYQAEVCGTLQALYENRLIGGNGEPLDILILNLPPGFGKSYTASLFATWIYGKDVKSQVIEVSYNQTLSIQFSKTVRDLIEDEEIAGDPDYFTVRSFFPNLKIKYGDAAMERWSLEGYYNSYLATSFRGSITGMRGSLGIIDDPIKNAREAVNDAVLDAHWDFYKNTFYSRMLDGAKQLIIQTRWATGDLTGRLLAEYPERCACLSMKALDGDGRSVCEDLYSTKTLLEKKATLDESFWLANYEQTPIDLQGALYGGFKTYEAAEPDQFERIISYTDTADEGADFLASVLEGVSGGFLYVLDIYYTDEPMERTEPELARRLHLYGAREAIIESNNGGRGFARNVTERLKRTGNKKCEVTWFHQSRGKRPRILVAAASVCERVIMPAGWEKRFPAFYKALTSYQRKGRNEHDDAPDALTGLYEFFIGEVKGRKRAKIFTRSKFGL